jgi:hypothetical protein
MKGEYESGQGLLPGGARRVQCQGIETSSFGKGKDWDLYFLLKVFNN